MASESEHAELIFDLKQALRSCRVSPKPERYDDIRSAQAEHILMHLTRCGWRIVKVERDTGPKPSNLG